MKYMHFRNLLLRFVKLISWIVLICAIPFFSFASDNVANDYYTYNFKECLLVELKEVVVDPSRFLNEELCGIGMLGHINGMPAIASVEQGHLKISNSIYFAGLSEDIDSLSFIEGKVKVFFYGELEIREGCWFKENEEGSTCRSLIYLQFPKLVLIND